jgi:hypothetical protein
MSILELVVSTKADRITIVEDHYLFNDEIWDTIKSFLGIKRDFPVQIIAKLNRIKSLEGLQNVLRSSMVKWCLYLKNKYGKQDGLDLCFRIRSKDLYHQLHYGNMDGFSFVGKREQKKNILRALWTTEHPDFYYILACEFAILGNYELTDYNAFRVEFLSNYDMQY